MSGSRVTCKVPGCKSTIHNSTLFNFPKNYKCEVWLKAINCPIINNIPKTSINNYKVCSRHFTPRSFLNSKMTKLNRNAVPTLELPYAPSETLPDRVNIVKLTYGVGVTKNILQIPIPDSTPITYEPVKMNDELKISIDLPEEPIILDGGTKISTDLPEESILLEGDSNISIDLPEEAMILEGDSNIPEEYVTLEGDSHISIGLPEEAIICDSDSNILIDSPEKLISTDLPEKPIELDNSKMSSNLDEKLVCEVINSDNDLNISIDLHEKPISASCDGEEGERQEKRIELNDIETTTGAITEIPEVAAPPPPKKPRIRLDWKRKCSEKKPLLSLNSSKISASLQRLLNAKEKDEYVNFNDVCRACLSSKSDMTEIKDVTLGEMTAQEVFEKYISVTIEDEGNLPQQLCTTCLYELCRVYLFINNCQAADTKLRELTTKYNNYEDELYHSTIPVNKNSEVEPPIEIQNPRDPEALMNMGPLKVDEPGPPYVCNNCKEVFETLKQIKLHRKQNKHYRVRQYLCRFCNPSKVYSFIHWKSHMITHTGLKPYDCQTCGKKFSTHANRARHILIHTGVKPFSCDICLKAFTQKTQLTAHNLKAHNTDKSKGHFECDECGKVLSSKASLVHHKVVHSEKKFLCTHCGKSFHYQMQFNMHMDSHLGIRRYKCQSCDKAFTRPLSLVLHKRTHTGHKPYQCKYCDKRFAQKGHLVCHNRIHTGERPYSCPYCDKTFALNGNLTVHIRKHTGENPFVCDICNKGFADSSSMNKHRKKVHTKETNVVFNRDLGEVISVPIHYQERRNMPVISFE